MLIDLGPIHEDSLIRMIVTLALMLKKLFVRCIHNGTNMLLKIKLVIALQSDYEASAM